MPGGPRGLQNRRRYASGEIGSIPILSAILLLTRSRKEVTDLSREQIRKLTSLSSCAG